MEEPTRQAARVARRKSAAGPKQGPGDSASSADNRDDVVALKKQIARLEAENKKLRKQIAALTDTTGRSGKSGSDSVREQQHNFFKYSNVRRY